MNAKQAEQYWQARMLETYKQNMVAVRWQIERRPHARGYRYCISQYVASIKTAEYWPEYRGGIRYGANLQPYGEDFLATETLNGNPV